jgi:two-component system cell cycle response regulator
MNPEVIEKILSCPTLPSLPAVALRVIELTSDPNVKLTELAATIQNDQGLAAKVLRTVNSSFYGLRTRCANINKALVLLGLGPVKALALGFSLVSSVDSKGNDGFDYSAYWRRGLFTAVGAKCIAEVAGRKFGDEAFLGGLLQDIGCIALHRALRREYSEVIASAGGDHRKLLKLELEAFEIGHTDVGAMLAARWKFPDQLIIPVKYHERPSAAPLEHSDLVRAVGLGNLIHDVLSNPDPIESLRRLYTSSKHWFDISESRVDEALHRASEASREMASLFQLDVGAASNSEAVLQAAESRLLEMSRAPLATSPLPGDVQALVKSSTDIDPMTGALSRTGFDRVVRSAFETVRTSGESLSLVQVSLDGLRDFGTALGQTACDDLVCASTSLLAQHFGPFGAVICRLNGEIFAGVIVGAQSPDLATAAERFRAGVERAAVGIAKGAPGAPRVAASIGVATVPQSEAVAASRPEGLVVSAARAVQASRAAGGNCVRTVDVKKAA